MKRYGLIVLVGMCICFLSQPGTAQPVIHFDKTHFDFGTTYPNQLLSHTFVFTNKGNQPLQITKVSTTCGCTAAILSATTILPSATGIVSVTMATRSPIKKNESAHLETNDPKNRRVTLTIETVVKNLWTVSPQKSFLFNELSFDSEQSKTLRLKNTENKPFKIISTSAKEKEIAIHVGSMENNEYPITVTIHAGHEKKLLNDQVLIKTDHPKQPIVSIPVFGRIIGVVKFNRNRVFFGTLKAGTSKTLEITARLTNLKDPTSLQIMDIQSEPDTVKGTPGVRRGDGSYAIQLTFTAPDKVGYHTGTIHFKTNIPEEPEVTLPFSALVRAR